MKFSIALMAVALAAGISGPVDSAGIQQAFLVQNSGWMEPFYVDPQSRLKPLVAAVAQAASGPSDTVFILAFSQSTSSNLSPVLLGQGQGAAVVQSQLAALTLARKGTGPALADTDFQEAILKTITGPFKSAPGILWIFTNNKNSPNNDLQTAARNRDFYRLLHLEPSITKTLVFPLRMPVQGKLYAAKGMMVYALAYGPSAAEALDSILAQGRLTKVLTTPPARLKPVDQDPVKIIPEGVKNSGNIKVSLGADHHTVVLDVDAANLVPTVVLQASLQNMFVPYVIESAKISASLNEGGKRTQLHVTPDMIQQLQPGTSQSVQVQFALPMARIPSPWSAQAIAAMGKQVLLPITADIDLNEQRLVLAPDFSNQMRELFPGDPISAVFSPPESIRASHVRIPFLVRIQYPLLPVMIIIAIVILLVCGLALLGLLLVRRKHFALVVDGVNRQILLKPFTRMAIKDTEGETIGEIKRGLGAAKVVRIAGGHTLRID